MQWSDVLKDESLRDLPYKIELNEYGKIEMSPASNKHGLYQIEIAKLLTKLPSGKVIAECSIQTNQGVKVADVVWCSNGFLKKQCIEETPFRYAPEICVEIISPSNSYQEMQNKRQLYFDKGAKEVWLVSLDDSVQLFDKTGKIEQSHFGIQVEINQN